MTFLEAAYKILKKKRKPLHSKEILKIALKKNFIKTKGKTPEATMNAVLLRDIKVKRNKSKFVKVGPCTFAVNPRYKEVKKKTKKIMREIKQFSNHFKGEDQMTVTRYEGAQNIRQMMMENHYIEAFVHTQLGIEKILWDKIVAIFERKKAMIVRRTIEESRKGEDKTHTKTYELIKWAHFLNAIDDNEFSDLIDFNHRRNDLFHSHGEWWNRSEYKEALIKGIRFLEKNNL